ncbi:HupE/UreJ family protein [Aurantivibrio infirmus]
MFFQKKRALAITLGILSACLSFSLWSHNISESNAQFVEGVEGAAIAPFMYLGAKHMVTGYDHLLFLVGVIFFLFRLKDVVLYVSLFTLGHSITLLGGVLGGLQVNAYLIDAIIGFSIVYKAFENMGGFEKVFHFQPNTKIAVLFFGLFHGLGLATKLQDFSIAKDGLITNIISFNIGVEIGQIIALSFILILLWRWRQMASFNKHAFLANSLLMTGGFLLAGYQLTGYFA